MTEQDALKDAMESPPDFEPAPLDLGAIMGAGSRLRRRRRFAAGTASVMAVTAVFVVGNQLMSMAEVPRSTGWSGPAGTAVQPTPSRPAPSGGNSPNPVPSTLDSSAPGVLGKIVYTGQRVDGREWVLYAETRDPDKINDNLTLVLGRTETGYINDFTTDIVSDDTGGRRMSPGFHAVRAGTILDGRTTPTFGYYAGDAYKITARDTKTGTQVNAHLTAWSSFDGPEQAQIFWFDFTQGRQPMTLTGLTAYDRQGNQLPA
jgi:hypothetical protein